MTTSQILITPTLLCPSLLKYLHGIAPDEWTFSWVVPRLPPTNPKWRDGDYIEFRKNANISV